MCNFSHLHFLYMHCYSTTIKKKDQLSTLKNNMYSSFQVYSCLVYIASALGQVNEAQAVIQLATVPRYSLCYFLRAAFCCALAAALMGRQRSSNWDSTYPTWRWNLYKELGTYVIHVCGSLITHRKHREEIRVYIYIFLNL